MPVSVVVGGQYGSEGKGKVALALADARDARAVVRVGGPNSGHTVLHGSRRWILRQLPTAALLPGVRLIIPAGAYVDVELLSEEIRSLRIDPSRLTIDPSAAVVTKAHRNAERKRLLRERIGSTLSGTGAAHVGRLGRGPEVILARDEIRLQSFLGETKEVLNEMVDAGGRVVVEGTQGHGLSVFHSRHYPFVTSRDTSASAFLSEVGLAPTLVDEVALVIRTYPIRVGGSSGPLEDEIDWATVTKGSGGEEVIEEFTSVTRQIRRVGRFSAQIVRDAIQMNRPTLLVLNHLDYVDCRVIDGHITACASEFVSTVEESIGRQIEFVGIGPARILDRFTAAPALCSSRSLEEIAS